MKKPIPKLLGNIISRVLMGGIGVVAIYSLAQVIPPIINFFDSMSHGGSMSPAMIPYLVVIFAGVLSLIPVFIGVIVAEINRNPAKGACALRKSFSIATFVGLVSTVTLIILHFTGSAIIEQLVLSIVLAVLALVLSIVNLAINKKAADNPALMIISTLFVGYFAYYMYGLSIYFYITLGLLMVLAIFLLLTDFEGNNAKVEQPQVKSGPAIAEADDEKEKGDAPKAKRKFWTERGMYFSNEE